MESRRESLGQVKKALIEQRTDKTTERDVINALRDLDKNTKLHRKVGYEDQKRLVRDVNKKLKGLGKGKGLLGYGKSAAEKGVLTHLRGQRQGALAESAAPGMGSTSTKKDIAAERIDLSGKTAPGGPQIGMAPKDASISLASSKGSPKPLAPGTNVGSLNAKPGKSTLPMDTTGK